MIGFIIALVSGALMSIQGVFNTEVSKQTGLWTASSFVQFTGLLTLPCRLDLCGKWDRVF